jgi:hypothetical protein
VADRAAWVAQAFRRYHAGKLTLEQLQAMVREHRGHPAAATDDDGA